jgi:hypothetical protein
MPANGAGFRRPDDRLGRASSNEGLAIPGSAAFAAMTLGTNI